MKNVKRMISLVLVVVMSLGVFTGCKKEKEGITSTGERKLVVGVPQDSTIPDYDTNALTRYLKETTGIEIEWSFFSNSAANYKQQLTLMCTGNEKLPDVIVGMNGLSHYVVNQFGEDGYFIDLKPLIKDYAPNYKEQVSKQDKDMQKYIEEKGTNTNTGAFYAMPSVNLEAIDNLQSLVYINHTWLNKLGLKMPTNVKELVEVCRAFAKNDPNGNGLPDEIPMLGGATLRYWLMNAYVEYDNNNFNVKDGKVWDPVVSDEFRQGLIFINDLVKEGLLSELGFTLSQAEQKNLISPKDGVGKVGIFVGHHEKWTNANTDALDHFTAMGPLADETGKGGYLIVNEIDCTWQAFITKDCQNPDVAMEFLDAFYTDECVTRQRHGEKDVDWYYEEGKNAYGTDSYARVINSQAFFDGSMNCTLGNLLGIMTQWNYLLVAEEGEGRAAQASRLQSELWNIMQNEGKRQEGMLSRLVYTSDEYEVREDKASAVSSYITEETTLFAKGEKDVRNDKNWNEFVSTLQALGRAELMEIAQNAYNRKVGK